MFWVGLVIGFVLGIASGIGCLYLLTRNMGNTYDELRDM